MLNKRYKVLSAKLNNTYHYHGTHFDYSYFLELLSEDGRTVSNSYWTSDYTPSLVGKTIILSSEEKDMSLN